MQLLRPVARLHILVSTILLVASSCLGQQRAEIPTPDAPTPATQESSVLQPAPTQSASTHAFWDKENIWLFSGVAAFRALDYASTRNMQARGREEILIPDDVVNNSAGFASLEAAATMTSVGISYIFHRTGHHKLERWVSIIHMSATATGDARNYALKSKHPQ